MLPENSQEFRDLVGEVIGDITPIKRDQTTVQRAPKVNTPGVRRRHGAAQQEIVPELNGLASEEHISLLNPHDQLSFKRDGVQHGVFKKLRLGKYLMDTRLDLHHHRVEQARKAVLEFIRDCVESDIRYALITHGKGELRDKPALLKSCVNHWLKELDVVLAFHSAQLCHGGAGATYVMLRKSVKQRDLDRK